MDSVGDKENSEKFPIYSWGFGKYSQIGEAGLNYSICPLTLNFSTSEIFQVSGGEFHSFVLAIDNSVYAFGKNTYGQLGFDNTTQVSTPLYHEIASQLKFSQISCGGEHTLALTQNFEVYSWGFNIFGQLGLKDNNNRLRPCLVEFSDFIDDESVKMIAAGAHHSLISTNKNNLFSCGFGRNYALGHEDSNKNLNLFTKITSANIIVTLTKNQKIDMISCGVNHSGCIINKEYLIIWGKSENLCYEKPTVVVTYSLNNSPSKNKQSSNYLKEFKIGDDFLIYLTVNSEVFSIGKNDSGQLGLKNFVDRKVFEKLEFAEKIKSVELGYNFCFAIGEKNVYAWGNNQFGQLMVSEMEMVNEPIVINHLANIQPKIGCGGYHSLAFSKNNTLLKINSENPVLDKMFKMRKIYSQQVAAQEQNFLNEFSMRAIELEGILKEKSSKLQEITSEIEEMKKKETSQILLKKPTKPVEYTRGFDNNFEISETEIQFDQDAEIGKGTFGEVLQGTWRKTSVACKFLKDDLQNTEDNIRQFIEECTMLKNLRHPNILLFMGACTKGPKYFIVTEFCENGNLFELLHQHRSYQLSWEDRRRIAIEIAQGMNYLHTFNPPILHRDLKSMNVLLDSYLTVKIADFGSTKFLDIHMTNQKGTFQWMAPEVIKYSSYTEKADVFSFAIIMNELATRSPPYLGIDKHKVAESVGSKGNFRPQIPKTCPQAFSDLMIRCWDNAPEKRPPFSEIIEILTKMKLK